MEQQRTRERLAVLFADITGSTGLYASRGDTVAFELNARCLRLLETEVERHQGRAVKRVGDAILAVFPVAEAAVRAAEGMMRALDAPGCTLYAEGVRIRVGVSYGQIVSSDGDVYGDTVNLAARLIGLAGAEEILVSGPLREMLPPGMQASARSLEQLALRGRSAAVSAYQYLWRREGATLTIDGKRVRGSTSLEIDFGGRRFTIDDIRPILTIGRAPDNDLVIDERSVSRHHVEIALRGDKFLLTDRSTNGTDVRLDQGPTLRACREELVLVGRGSIILGEEADAPVRYRVAGS